ncbi:MAG: ankyrin repeat domain-containing protein [Oligoflexia bacterium]|nr:ankyrin repeat domain-containing protein [Oligoflexia bacterium]
MTLAHPSSRKRVLVMLLALEVHTMGAGPAIAAPLGSWMRSPIISVNTNEKEALNTAFRIAARDDRIEQLEEHLRKGAAIDSASSEGMTALMYASLHCHSASVEALLKAGANANARDQKGRTALIFAARGACLPVARLLLRVPGIRWRNRDSTRRSAYQYAEAAAGLEVDGTATAIMKLLRGMTARE